MPTLSKQKSDALIAAYARYTYATTHNAPIAAQQQFYKSYQTKLDAILDAAGLRVASEQFMTDLDRRARKYLLARPMKGAGVWW